MEKIPQFGRIIPLSAVKNQIKMNRRSGAISPIWHSGDTSDELSDIQQIKIITD
jgi:hypothetical protein